MVTATALIPLPQATTAERNADYTAVANGSMFYNSTLTVAQITYDGGTTWIDLTGGGSGVSLQHAYDNGRTIETPATDEPVVITSGASGAGGLFSVTDTVNTKNALDVSTIVQKIETDYDFFSEGLLGMGATIGAPGAGTRFFFNGNKSAIRAGTVDATQWDSVNVGNFSAAFCQGTTASGESSFAAGFESIASGSGSTALGIGGTASSIGAFIGGGSDNTASTASSNAVIGGTLNTVTGEGAVIIASDACSASGTNAAVIAAVDCTANGQNSVAMGGEASNATGINSVSIGNRITNSGDYTFVFSDNTISALNVPTANSFYVRASGGVVLDSNTATIELGDKVGGNTVNVSNAGIALTGTTQRQKFIANGAYDAAGINGAGQSRPYNGVSVWTFGGTGAIERVNIRDAILPFDYDNTTQLVLEMVYMPTTVAAGNAVFNFYYQVNRANDSAVLDTTPPTNQAIIAMSTVAERPETYTFNVTDFITTSNPGDILMFGVERDPGDVADDYTDDVWVTNIRFKYTSKLA